MSYTLKRPVPCNNVSMNIDGTVAFHIILTNPSHNLPPVLPLSIHDTTVTHWIDHILLSHLGEHTVRIQWWLLTSH